MLQHHGARDLAIGIALRPGIAGTGGGQGFEAQAGEHPRGAHVPRIGNNEAALLMQVAKRGALIPNGDGHDDSWLTPRPSMKAMRKGSLRFLTDGAAAPSGWLRRLIFRSERRLGSFPADRGRNGPVGAVRRSRVPTKCDPLSRRP